MPLYISKWRAKCEISKNKKFMAGKIGWNDRFLGAASHFSPKKQPKAALPSRKPPPEQGKKLSNQGRNVCHVANIVTSKIKVGNSEESVL